jgi:hypothetical protein
MKMTLFICLTLVFSGGVAASFGPGQERAASPPSERNGAMSNALSAKVQILSQTYCHVDDDSFSVLLNVQVRFTNVSNQPVILSRRIENAETARVATSNTAGELGQFESAPQTDRFVKENLPNPPVDGPPNPEYFIILAPGQSYDTKISAAVPATRESKAQHGLLSPGEHVLQLAVSTWPYYGFEDGGGLRRKWAQFGDLQVGLIYTSFVPFRIPVKFRNPRCSIPYANPHP